MKEKRFYYLIHNLNEDDEHYEIIDKEQRYSFNFVEDEGLVDQVCWCLNEQQELIGEKSNTITLMGAFIKSKGFSVDDFNEWISEDWNIGWNDK